jgi:hypothetical protein
MGLGLQDEMTCAPGGSTGVEVARPEVILNTVILSSAAGTTRALLIGAFACICCCLGGAAATPDDNWDAAFGLTPTEGGIASILCLGKDVYFAGYFNQIGGIPAANIARHDGTNWFPLGTGLTGGNFPGVQRLAVCRGQLHAAGSFTEADGVVVDGIARWDGTDWHGLGGVDQVIFDIASDGQNLYAGGHFNVAGGVATTRIGKWNGTNWSGLGIGFGGIYPAAVDSVAVSGNDVYAGGRFVTAGGVAATNIARWDGTNWHALGNGLRQYNSGFNNGAVRVLLVHQGLLFAGGEFGLAGDTSVQNIARWDGTNWSPVGSIAAGSVQALVSNGTDLYAGNVGSGIISKWDGSAWSSLGSGLSGDGLSGGAIACNGTELYVGGYFSLAGGKPANNLARWHIPHSLAIQHLGPVITLSWPATGTNFLLEGTGSLSDTNWSVVSTTHVLAGNECRVTNSISASAHFFRLRRK